MDNQGRGPDPAALKFTGIKVHVSQLSKKYSSKAVVISNGTSSHDVIKMVARKLHMDQKQTNKMCLVVELCTPDPHNGREMYQEMILRDDEPPLSLYENYPKGAVRFTLAWRDNYTRTEKRENHHHLQYQHRQPHKQAQYNRGLADAHLSQTHANPAHQTMDRLQHKLTKYNGCTLPGGGAPTGKPTLPRGGGKPVHPHHAPHREEFLIQYEPYTLENSQSMYGINHRDIGNGNALLETGYERRSIDNRRRSWDPSMFSQTTKEVNNNFYRVSPRSEQGRNGHGDTGGYVTSSNGTSSMTSFSSTGSAFTPTAPLNYSSADGTTLPHSTSSGTSSSASIHSLPVDASDSRNYSLPNIGDMEIAAATKQRNKVVHSNSFSCLRDKKRARNLPTLQISREYVEEKRRSIADQFSDKLRKYLKERRASLNTSYTSQGSSGPPEPLRVEYDPVQDRDDTMSVTSMEVADILAGAAPPAPSDEEDENYDGDVQSDSTIERDSPMGECTFVPTKFAEGPITKEVVPVKQSPALKEAPSKHQHHHRDKPDHLTSFVEQSMKSFISKVNTTGKGKEKPTGGSLPPTPPKESVHANTRNKTTKNTVPLFTILRTHVVNCVSVLKQRRKDQLGIIVHDAEMDLPNGMSEYSRQSNGTEKRMFCMVSACNPGPSVFVVGDIRRGDVILEANGYDCTTMSSDELNKLMNTSDVVKMVVARPRAIATTGTDP